MAPSVTYSSTRGSATEASSSFREVVLAGLCKDKGLFVPDTIPTVGRGELESWRCVVGGGGGDGGVRSASRVADAPNSHQSDPIPPLCPPPSPRPPPHSPPPPPPPQTNHPDPSLLRRTLNYAELSTRILAKYIGPDQVPAEDLSRIITTACGNFRHPQVTPLQKVNGHYVLELFHGPTFAFKDVALQMLGGFFEYVRAQTDPSAAAAEGA
jgi:threonine synthase